MTYFLFILCIFFPTSLYCCQQWGVVWQFKKTADYPVLQWLKVQIVKEEIGDTCLSYYLSADLSDDAVQNSIKNHLIQDLAVSSGNLSNLLTMPLSKENFLINIEIDILPNDSMVNQWLHLFHLQSAIQNLFSTHGCEHPSSLIEASLKKIPTDKYQKLFETACIRTCLDSCAQITPMHSLRAFKPSDAGLLPPHINIGSENPCLNVSEGFSPNPPQETVRLYNDCIPLLRDRWHTAFDQHINDFEQRDDAFEQIKILNVLTNEYFLHLLCTQTDFRKYVTQRLQQFSGKDYWPSIIGNITRHVSPKISHAPATKIWQAFIENISSQHQIIGIPATHLIDSSPN